MFQERAVPDSKQSKSPAAQICDSGRVNDERKQKFDREVLRRGARRANRTVEERMQIGNDPDTSRVAANDGHVAPLGLDSQRKTSRELDVYSMLVI